MRHQEGGGSAMIRCLPVHRGGELGQVPACLSLGAGLGRAAWPTSLRCLASMLGTCTGPVAGRLSAACAVPDVQLRHTRAKVRAWPSGSWPRCVATDLAALLVAEPGWTAAATSMLCGQPLDVPTPRARQPSRRSHSRRRAPGCARPTRRRQSSTGARLRRPGRSGRTPG